MLDQIPTMRDGVISTPLQIRGGCLNMLTSYRRLSPAAGSNPRLARSPPSPLLPSRKFQGIQEAGREAILDVEISPRFPSAMASGAAFQKPGVGTGRYISSHVSGEAGIRCYRERCLDKAGKFLRTPRPKRGLIYL